MERLHHPVKILAMWNREPGESGYESSQLATAGGRVFALQGRWITAYDPATGGIHWRAEASGVGVVDDARVLSGMAVGKQNLYVTTRLGQLVVLSQTDGKRLAAYGFGQPILTQPLLAGGRVYVGTTWGCLIALDLGEDADGWPAWGGGPAHSGARQD